MNIAVSVHQGCRHLVLQGEGVTPAEEREVLALLDAPSPLPLELHCYELKWLSAPLVEGIARVLTGDPRNRVRIQHSPLFTYLKGLGVPVSLIQRAIPGQPPRPPFQALALGGSADSLDKILTLIARLPLGEVALFVVQHVAEDKPNLLDELLRHRTDYRVLMPHHLTPVTPGTLYVAPPGHHLRVAHGLVYLTRDARINAARPAIDPLFESLAMEYGPGVLGVLLCGWGRDGVVGGRLLVERGGELLILDPDECPSAKAMVEHARQEVAGGVVLPTEAIATLLAAAATGSGPLGEREVQTFFTAVARVHGHDWGNYHGDMLGRRLERSCQELGKPGHYDCQRELLTSTAAYEQLFTTLSINVTAFFRMPGQFQLLRREILPYLASFSRIKIWVAGCSSGQEVYSLAIVLQEEGLLERSMVYATDINPFVLMQGRNGLYGRERLEECRANYRAAGGRGDFDHYCRGGDLPFFGMDPALRRNLLFYRHSLVGDGPFNEFHLIICRNLLIYFDGPLQHRVMELFDRSLHPDGILLLGEKEGIGPGGGERFFVPLQQGQSAYSRHARSAMGHDGH